MAALDEASLPGSFTALAINYGEDLSVVLDFIADTGIRSPILFDNPMVLEGCIRMPDGEVSVYQHFNQRAGSTDPQAPNPPFPLQVVLDSEGRIAHISKSHQPELILEILQGLLAG